MMKKYWFETEEANLPMVESMFKELGVMFFPMEPKGRTHVRRSKFSNPCGKGFGDHVWRINVPQNRVEASFARPCIESKMLKSDGFRWLHEDGIWYAVGDILKFSEICEKYGLRQETAIT